MKGRLADVYFQAVLAGRLSEYARGYTFEYLESYQGPPISLTMPVTERRYEFSDFPPFFDGLLPEGPQLEALLRQAKLDRHDLMGQLITVGSDLVGAVTVKEVRS